MIAVDTNLLVYAHREDSPWHDAAYARIAELAESRAPWAIPWPCLHEFLAIVTHPRIYAPRGPVLTLEGMPTFHYFCCWPRTECNASWKRLSFGGGRTWMSVIKSFSTPTRART